MKIVVVAPREEHWDGTGGAIATWVENVQVPSNQNLTVVGASRNGGNDWYNSPRRLQLAKVAISRTAALLSHLFQIKPKDLENALWLRGLLYVLLLLPEVRNADIVYIHNRPLYAKYFRVLGFSGKIILHMHNHATPYFRRMKAEHIHSIDHFLFCSEYIRHAAVNECSVPEERTAVLYNGVADNQVRHVSPMSLDLLFVGRLQEIKGTDVAIQAVSILRENGYDATLKLVGGSDFGMHDSLTPFSATLKQMAESVNAKFGSNVISFLGPKPLPEVLEHMAQSPLFIFPSRTEEAFGMVLAESLSRGSYPLATVTGGMPEILDIAGLNTYNSLYTAEEFAAAAIKAQESVTDAVRSETAQKVISRLNWSNIRKDYENLMDELSKLSQ